MLLQFLTLAWRNIWRNKRRAFLTSFSIIASLFFILLMRQMQLWTYDFNIKNTVSSYVGYIQITDSTYVDEKILDNTLALDQIPNDVINSIEGISGTYPRLLSGALVSTGIKSKFAGVMGIQPEIDNASLKLHKKLKEGTLLEDADRDVMITEKMAKYYQVKVGDSLVMIGQGYQGYTAAGIYKIKGILKFSTGDMANMVFLSLPESQIFFSAPNRVTHYLINLEKSKEIDKIAKELSVKLNNSSLSIRTWEEVLPGLKQGLELDSNSGLLISGILYMIVGFGIFGTIVMLYNERIFEFGILSAIGMSKINLLFTTLIEIFMLTVIGILMGNIVSFPLLYYLNRNPIELTGESAQGMIDQGFEPYVGTGIYWDVFLMNSLAILLISGVVTLYLIVKLLKLDPLNAMKQH